MRRYIVLFLMTVIVFPFQMSQAQNTKRQIDSLEALVGVASLEDLPRLYYELSYLSRFSNYIMGVQYAMKSLDVAEELDDKYYQMMALSQLAINERFAKMPDAALQHYQQALKLAQKFDYEGVVALCCNGISRLYLDKGNVDEARVYNGQAFEFSRMSGDSVQLSDTYVNLGLIMRSLGKTDLAIGYLWEAYEIRDKVMSKNDSEFLIPYWHLVDIYMERGDYGKAKEITHIILNNDMLSNWRDFISRLYYKMAQIYLRMGMADSALVSGQMALHESIPTQDPRRIEMSCKLLDTIYISMGEYKKAADICRAYSMICDTLFNKDMFEQLKKIQFSRKYMENEQSIRQERYSHTVSIFVLIFAVVALLGCAYFVYLMGNRNRKISHLHGELSKKREAMEHSLRYANAIQSAVLPDIEDFGNAFSDKFLLYIPRDIVSGDFFWKYSDDRYEILVVADCTGHGVPGAMLTMLGASILQNLASSGLRGSAEILEELRSRIKYLMGLNAQSKMQDGMDISLIVVDRETMEIDFAGAFNNLVYIRDGKMNTIKANRCPIGEYIVNIPFKSQKLSLMKGDTIFIMSDGYSSQFGGFDNSKLSQRNLLNILLEKQSLPMGELCKYLTDFFYEWKGDLDQVDDVTIAGFRV